MDVKSTLLAGIEHLESEHADATADARAWLDRVEILLDWIAQHPKFVEIRSEAARLLLQYRLTSPAAE